MLARQLQRQVASSSRSQARRAFHALPLKVSDEVASALSEGRPVVALESALISHGLPPPHSHELPTKCESILRAQGVTPATIALLDGQIYVGLTEDETIRLSELGFKARKDKAVARNELWKVGRRELATALVRGVSGGTTVSATMKVAELAGIRIFSTGGIGGVHRGAETSFDISSDLTSLSDTAVAVICAGCKSILDIGLTLEYLETLAVPVAAYGTDEWPAFYTAKSGFQAPTRLDGPTQAASAIIAASALSLRSSPLLLGVPIPPSYHEAGEALQRAVEQAVQESIENGVAKSGKEVTPWLLERVGQITKGSAVVSNRALIENNVKVGGEVAIEYARLLKEQGSGKFGSIHQPAALRSPTQGPAASTSALPTTSSLVVVGSLAVDVTLTPVSSPLQTTAPGRAQLSLGGVGGNVARAAHALGVKDTMMVAPLSADAFGGVARAGLNSVGMRQDGLIEMNAEDDRTAVCGILLDQAGDLLGGVADMSVVERLDGAKVTEKLLASQAKLVCMDGNLSPDVMAAVLTTCRKSSTPVFFEPTSNVKALRLLAAVDIVKSDEGSHLEPLVAYSTPNVHELGALYAQLAATALDSSNADDPFLTMIDSFKLGASFRKDVEDRLPSWVATEGVVPMAVRLMSTIGTLFIKSGSRGVVVFQLVNDPVAVSSWKAAARKSKKGVVVALGGSNGSAAIAISHFPALPLSPDEVVNVTGAGDNLAGGILAAYLQGMSPAVPSDLAKIVGVAQRAAVATLKSPNSVGDHALLSFELQRS